MRNLYKRTFSMRVSKGEVKKTVETDFGKALENLGKPGLCRDWSFCN